MCKNRFGVVILAFAALLAACDEDPTAPEVSLSLAGCPTDGQDVNAPIRLQFNRPVSATTVVPGNIVVALAETGVEVPGAIGVDPGDPSAVLFTPSQPLPFETGLRVRVQNVLAEEQNAPIDVTVCELLTGPAPISELFWTRLPSASGSRLSGASLPAPELSFVMTVDGVVFRRSGNENYRVVYQNPLFSAGQDVDFVSPTRGFASFRNTRESRSVLLESNDAGLTFDTLVSVTGSEIFQRLAFRRFGTGTTPPLVGIIGGGNCCRAVLWRLDPATGVLVRHAFGSTSYVNDVDFAPRGADPASASDTGAAVSNGFIIGSFRFLGRLFVTTNAGNSWTLADSASDTTVFFTGVGLRRNGDIFVGGGNGYFARYQRAATGGFTQIRLLERAIANPDTTDPRALMFTDVQFAPDNDQIGWVIGKQLIGTVGGVPRFRGFIFMTRDGGVTWTRQGVAGAEEFGAGFPGLDRLDVLSSTEAIAVGEEGTVLTFEGAPAAASIASAR